MRQLVTAFGLTLITVGLSHSGQFFVEDRSPDAVVTNEFRSPEVGDIRLLGVCDVSDASTVRCWNTDGITDQTLAESVKADITKHHPGLNLAFRRKNRLAVFWTHPVKPMSGPRPTVILRGTRTNYQPEILAVSGQDPNDRTELVSLCEDLSAKFTSAHARCDLSAGEAELVAAQEGAKSTGGSHPLTITRIREIPRDFSVYRQRQRAWQVFIKMDGDSKDSQITMPVEAIADNGKPVESFDAEGKPVARSGAFYIEDGMGPFRYMGTASYVQSFDVSSGERQFVSYVNPSQIKGFKFQFQRTLNVLFNEIPLDPKSQDVTQR